MTDNLGYGDLSINGGMRAHSPDRCLCTRRGSLPRLPGRARLYAHARGLHDRPPADPFRSLINPKRNVGVLPRVYSLRDDPKELFDLIGRSGGTPIFNKFQEVAAPYLISFQQNPNNDYSNIERHK